MGILGANFASSGGNSRVREVVSPPRFSRYKTSREISGTSDGAEILTLEKVSPDFFSALVSP
jgi:hypothetical protein